MDIRLPTELEQFVDQEVASGRFRSRSEAVEEALMLLRRREVMSNRLRQDLQSGIDQLDAGKYLEISSIEAQNAFIQELERATETPLNSAAN
ncbi:type II toxin-antitoxin system ParD family antitoxin [Planctomicrobium sp. SH661]|uniref:type II toxin-antitoxin system ParD family antitoxin n=1 Tax=Planctomicrobium sp. SH661 TaxID=3448124 RepID=UPI003F5BF700